MSKFHNVRTTVFGKKFDSKKEAERYLILLHEQEEGRIQDLRTQVKFELTPRKKGKYRTESAMSYKADFTYYRNGEFVVEDVKGYRTGLYEAKRKIMLDKYGISILET